MSENVTLKAEKVDLVEVEAVNPTTELSLTEKKTGMLSVNPFESKESFNDYWVMAKNFASSDMVPDNYRGKPMNCVIALEQAARMNTSPFFVMQNLYIVKNKPSWSGQACSMIVNGCGLFENVDLVYVGTPNTEDWGAYVKATRKSDGKELKGTTVDMKMAKAEGWLSNTKWKSMPEQMLGYRAYSFFARLYCPNALSGFSTEGEVEDIQVSKKSKVAGILKGE